MNSLFLSLLNMSLSASLVIAVVILLRFLMKKAPKSFFLLLWAVAAVRLIVPFSLFEPTWFPTENHPSSVPDVQTSLSSESSPTITSDESNKEVSASEPLPATDDSAVTAKTEADANIPETPAAVTPTEKSPGFVSSSVPTATVETPMSQSPSKPFGQTFVHARLDHIHLTAIALLWLCGVAAMVFYSLISYLRLSRHVRGAVHLRENLYQSDSIDSPFLMGFLKPKIYLPQSLSPADRELVIAHEQAHMLHHDHLIKLIGFILLTIYWFNPLVWAGYILLGRDIELACDERVIKKGGSKIKKAYSTALINCSVPKELTNPSPLAFGERAVKERVINVLRYHKPTAATIIACILTSVLVLASCAAPGTVNISENPGGESPSAPDSKDISSDKKPTPFDPEVKAAILAEMKKEAEANDGTINLKVWCATMDYRFEKTICTRFKDEYLKDADFEIILSVKNAIGEPDAGGKIIEQKKDGADVFNFEDSHLDMLCDANAISEVPALFNNTLMSENSADSLAAATVNGTLYCYPKSCDNGYFLYYDKRVLNEKDVKSFDSIIAKSKKQHKHVFMNLGDAWYGTAFYLTAGVDISYRNGIQTANFDTPEALSAAKAMCHIAENNGDGFIGTLEGIGHNGPVDNTFESKGFSAAVIGTWEGKMLKDDLGLDNLGAAKLPTVLMDGEQKQLHSFLGNKMVGVNSYSQCPFSAHVLAWYLTNEQSQIERYRARNILPTNLKALDAGMEDDNDPLKIRDDVAFKAIEAQKPFSHPMKTTVSNQYWGLGAGTFGAEMVDKKGALDDQTLQKRLHELQENLKKPVR